MCAWGGPRLRGQAQGYRLVHVGVNSTGGDDVSHSQMFSQPIMSRITQSSREGKSAYKDRLMITYASGLIWILDFRTKTKGGRWWGWGGDCLLKFYLNNDAAADRIPDLDPVLLFFSKRVSPVSTNGGRSDTQPKVNFFMWLTAVLESWRQLPSYTSGHPLSNIMKGAINNNPLQGYTASTFISTYIVVFYYHYSHSCECQCVVHATSLRLQKTPTSNPKLLARIW